GFHPAHSVQHKHARQRSSLWGVGSRPGAAPDCIPAKRNARVPRRSVSRPAHASPRSLPQCIRLGGALRPRLRPASTPLPTVLCQARPPHALLSGPLSSSHFSPVFIPHSIFPCCSPCVPPPLPISPCHSPCAPLPLPMCPASPHVPTCLSPFPPLRMCLFAYFLPILPLSPRITLPRMSYFPSAPCVPFCPSFPTFRPALPLWHH
ncbi:unnamed protein product, partial [Closterium sp. NIES-54]